MNGFGTKNYTSGRLGASSYQGYFFNGIREGYGKRTIISGPWIDAFEEGIYVNDKLQGVAIETWSTGEKKEFFSNNGRVVSGADLTDPIVSLH